PSPRRGVSVSLTEWTGDGAPSPGGLPRVCHLGKFYPPARGGMESHVRTLAQAQAALGAAVRVVCRNHLDADGRDVTRGRFALPEPREERDGPVRVLRVGRRASLARFEVCFRLPEVLRRQERQGIDLLHLHVPNPTMMLALAALRPTVPLVITHHSDVVRQKRLARVIRPLEHLVYRKA